MPEYRDFRCCMCPNVGEQNPVCPGIAGTLHPEPSPCRFVKRYIDGRGWTYFVRSGIGPDTFKAFYQAPGKQSPHGVKAVPWRDTFDQAQADLNAYAQKKGWVEICETSGMA